MTKNNVFYIGSIKYEFNYNLMSFIDSTELMKALVNTESVLSRSVTDKEAEVQQFLKGKVTELKTSAKAIQSAPIAPILTLNDDGSVPADVSAQFDCEVIDGILTYNVNKRSQNPIESTPVALAIENNESTINMFDEATLVEFTRTEVQPVNHTFLYVLDNLAGLTNSAQVFKVTIPWSADTSHFLDIAFRSKNQIEFETNAATHHISGVNFYNPTAVVIKTYYYLSPSTTVNKFYKYKIASILGIDDFNDVVVKTTGIEGLLNELKTGGFDFYNFFPNNTSLFEQERKIFFDESIF